MILLEERRNKIAFQMEKIAYRKNSPFDVADIKRKLGDLKMTGKNTAKPDQLIEYVRYLADVKRKICDLVEEPEVIEKNITKDELLEFVGSIMYEVYGK